jgi:NADPH-dependent 7-cyano-7-deazaguanine reductase QueF-like protein
MPLQFRNSAKRRLSLIIQNYPFAGADVWDLFAAPDTLGQPVVALGGAHRIL